jgi:basic membrane lipoprotein Med (substrate-binding protein (PBP1-ABC) superfamily)
MKFFLGSKLIPFFVLACMMGGILTASAQRASAKKKGTLLVYVGTYTGNKSQGIYRFH